MDQVKKRILIIEDEREMAEMLKESFESHDFEVQLAFDGQVGFDAVSEFHPDCIILDVMMPKLDGFHVCRLIKFNESTKGIPVVIISARGDETDRVVGYEVRADAYITKPFEWKHLLHTVDRLMLEAVTESS